MRTRTTNAATQSAAQRPSADAALHEANPADIAELRHALAATELRFDAALRQIERMRRRDLVLQQEAALLKAAVVKARTAYHDDLTGLPNRHVLMDHFKLAAALAARHDRHVALLFLDLDRFKHVNDTLGHSAGDQLLRQVAGRLVACLRASDTACRYGGDEFIVLLPELRDKNAALVVADHIRAHLAAPFLVEGASITITVSLGVAMHAVDAHSFADLVRVSDRAMYRDKARRPMAPSIAGATLVSLFGSDESNDP